MALHPCRWILRLIVLYFLVVFIGAVIGDSPEGVAVAAVDGPVEEGAVPPNVVGNNVEGWVKGVEVGVVHDTVKLSDIDGKVKNEEMKTEPDTVGKDLLEAEQLYVEALAMFDSKDNTTHPKALAKMEDASSRGYMNASLYLAYAYLFGTVLEQDISLSYKYVTELSSANHPQGLGLMGFFWATGLAGEKNEQKALRHYRQGAQKKDPLSMANIAFRYQFGQGISRSSLGACTHLQILAKQALEESDEIDYLPRTSPRLYEEYIMGENKSLIDWALEKLHYLEITAALGVESSLLSLGELYFYGNNQVAIDYEKAYEYLIVLEDHSARASGMLGEMYSNGLGVKADNDTALMYYRRAAKKGEAMGMTGIGKAYFYGLGVPKNRKTAKEWFEKAANLDEPFSLTYLGLMYFENKGVKKSSVKAAKYFKRAALLGHMSAQYHLGKLYLEDLSLLELVDQAAVHLKESYEQGPMAEYGHKGYLAFKENRPMVALVYYLYAAQSGQEVAQSNAAYLVELNDYTPFIPYNQRHQYAISYWEMAAEQGSTIAMNKIGDYYYYGLNGKGPDYHRALASYKDASTLHSGQALYNLAYMHQKGLGVQKDHEMARNMYLNAVETSGFARLPSFIAMCGLFLDILLFDTSSVSLSTSSLFKDIGFDVDYNLVALTICLALLIHVRNIHRRGQEVAEVAQ